MFIGNKIIKNRKTYVRILSLSNDPELNSYYFHKGWESPLTIGYYSEHDPINEVFPNVIKIDNVQVIENAYDDKDNQIKSFVSEIFQSAQNSVFNLKYEDLDSIFNHDDEDFNNNESTFQEIVYGCAELTPIPDKLETKKYLKISGMDSGGEMALENMFG